MQEADPIEAYRLQANLKSIHRSDTAVQAILSSSNYATIYHYEQEAGPTGEGEWVKQKAEGPLFVVKRTSPEHAIFMLNRQTVKNVTIPLIPGEMKVTAVGAGMLQIARRGESMSRILQIPRDGGVRRGVWFSEGEPMVEKFRQTILSICGEPSARPPAVQRDSQSQIVNSSSPAHQERAPASTVQAVTAGEGGQDGLSRLFAGLMPSGPSSSSTPPAPPALGTQSFAHHSQHRPPTQDRPSSDFHDGHHDPTIVYPKSPSPVQATSHPVQRPGETVDDLLSSILGVGVGGGGIKNSAPFSPPLTHAQSTTGVPERSMTPSQPQPAPPAALHVGTASPFPSFPQPPSQSSQMGNNRPHSPFAPPQMGSPGPAIMHSPLRREQRPNSDATPSGPAFPGAAMQQMNGNTTHQGTVAREAVVDVLQRAMPDMRGGGKEGLARTVAGLIANEPRFVDDLWESYVRRLNGAPG